MGITERQQECLDMIHKINYDMLDEIERMSKEYGFDYYLSFGTLLGAVRHGDHIPWDDDADIMMKVKDYQKFRSLSDKMNPRFKIIDPDDFGNKYYNMVPHVADTNTKIISMNEEKATFYEGVFSNNPYLDIFFVVKTPKGIRGKLYKYRLMLLYAMAGGHRLRSLSGVTNPAMAIPRFILESLGKLFSAQQIRDMILAVLQKYDDCDDCLWLVANGEVADFKFTSAKSYKSTTYLKMGEKSYKAPIGFEEVLRATYGDYMELPPVDKRVPVHYSDVEITEKAD